MTRILITGVRGKTGAPLAALLAARPDVEVLGGSSDPSTVTMSGVRPTSFSWDHPASWPAATAGVDAVYVVRPDRPDAPELIADLVASMPAHTHVVLLSDRDVDSFALDNWTLRAERAVRESGHRWTILRPGWFMQVLSDERFVRDQVVVGELPFADGGARMAWIDARDIAAVAERALLEEGHAERIYELTGPQALTLPQTAHLLSGALGRPVVHVAQTIEESVAGMAGFDRQLSQTTLERVRTGFFAAVTDTVERVTGRPARTLQTFLDDTWPSSQ